MTARQLKLALAVLLTALVLVIIVQNTDVVTVRLLLWSFTMSRVILILICTLSGFGVGYLAARLRASRSSRAAGSGKAVPPPV